MKRLIALLLACLALALPAHAGKAKPPKPPTCSAFGWCKVGTVANLLDNYTPIVPLTATTLRAYSNTAGGLPGDFWKWECSWTACSSYAKVLDVTEPASTYVRTTGVARGASGTYYAVLYVGNGYPTTNGYTPSWATSPDGTTWTWHGRIEAPIIPNLMSGNNLIVDESRTDDYRFMFWTDSSEPAHGVYLYHSADGVTWYFDPRDVWPLVEDDQPVFCAAARTPFGYHLMCANTYPATALRHLFSCDGLPPWSVLEMDSFVRNASYKGTNLAFDPATGLLHAVTGGVHFQMSARAFPC